MRARDPARTQTRLLEAAATEFAAHGYAGARVARIARRARANQRMVYHYFGSKEGLYEAMFLRLEEDIMRRLGPVVERLEQEPLQGLGDGVRRYFDLVREHPHFSRLALAEALARKRHLGYELTDRDPGFQMMGRLQPLIERGRAEGVLTDRVDVLLALAFALTLCIIYPLLADRLGNFYDAAKMAAPDRDAFTREQLVNLFLYGIAGPKAKPWGGRPAGRRPPHDPSQ